MAISFTPEQRQVIELHHCNILVSAAAGSGKTAVLVERIVEMVCDEEDPTDIDRLLVVTFTNAAAAEMRERIGLAIADRLREDPTSEHLQRQATLLHNALITTIDSFSLFLVRNHFHEIGLDPAFRVADEGEIRLLQGEVLEELLEEAFAQGNEAFYRCVETFCPGGRETALEQNILNLSRYAASFPWPDEWLAQRKSDFDAGSIEAFWSGDCGEYLRQYLRRSVEGGIAALREAEKICEEPDGPYMYGEMIESEREQLEALLDCEGAEQFAERLPAVQFGRLSSKRDDSVNGYKREYVKELRKGVKDMTEELAERFFATPFPLAFEQSSACAEPVGTLLDLTLDFNRRMREKKQEKKIIDFSDMEHYALDILTDRGDGRIRPSAVALEYRQFFREILIDEYQDSNLVQEYLLQIISGEEEGRYNRFMVGDVKQSIYKFRLARPELFLEKYERYGEAGDRRRIDLSRNFRSRGQVIDTVNDIFGRIMSRECGGIAYDEKAMLYAGASYPQSGSCESELILVEKPGSGEKVTAKQAEALAVAGKIQELLRTGQVTDRESGALRPVRYSDIVILLRTNSGWDEEFKTVLESKGIPVYITSKTGYFAAAEVQELLNVLRVLDNPLQDIPLFGVLKSVFGGFTEEEIAGMRSRKKGCSLYEALKACAAEEGAGAVGEKAGSFLKKLEEYRACTVYLPIRELLQRLVEERDYLSYVTALPGGSKRRANVEMLFTKASDFEKTSYFGLFHFIRYMEQLEKYDVDYGAGDMLDENADVVRIMSIHKSKGLEFPVTIVSGLAKRFNMQDVNQQMIVDMQLGMAVDFVDTRSRLRNKTLRRQVISCKMREDNLAEELRVLYVALTRAKEKLIMTAALGQPEERLEMLRESGGSRRERLHFRDFNEARSFLDLLLPVIGNTRTEVTVKGLSQLAGEELSEQVQLLDRRTALTRAAEYADEQALKTLRERFARQYPYRFLEGLYTKTTVSELKIAAMSERDEAAYHAFEEKEVVPYIPAFRREKETVTGTVRGNAYHKAMELLDFQRILGGQFDRFPERYREFADGLDHAGLLRDTEEFLREQTRDGRMPEEYYEVLRMPKIAYLMASELGWRMWRAQREEKLYREQPFVLGIEASRLKADFPGEEKVLIQGIIDVFFEEEDGIVLLDYKTDAIQDMQALWARYETQLQYYEEALQLLKGKRVKEKLLYSFSLESYGSGDSQFLDATQCL